MQFLQHLVTSFLLGPNKQRKMLCCCKNRPIYSRFRWRGRFVLKGKQLTRL